MSFSTHTSEAPAGGIAAGDSSVSYPVKPLRSAGLASTGITMEGRLGNP